MIEIPKTFFAKSLEEYNAMQGIGIELNPEYAKLAENRIEDNQSLFTV